MSRTTEIDGAVMHMESAFIDADRKLPCVLVLDTSGSMRGRSIVELNRGLAELRDALLADHRARREVDLATVAFGGNVRIVHEFVSADCFTPPILNARGNTPMGQALTTAMDGLAAVRAALAKNGIPLSGPPWLFLISDGAPTDSWASAASRIRAETARRQLHFQAVGVDNADMDVLTRLSSPSSPPFHLRGVDFSEVFRWLSSSLQAGRHGPKPTCCD